MSKHQFQTEVSQLLDIIVHSLYSNKEIFLRELVSNASDALDKLKYLTLTDEALKELPFDPRIDIEFDETDHKTLTVSDTGIGMNEEDLIENLGMIAKSGTKGFLAQLTGDAKKDSNLIGQFGVGFYSVFMVSDKVEVTSRKAGEDQAWTWVSDGKGEYEIRSGELDSNGTRITLHLNEDGTEFANRWRIQEIVKRYSDHIPFPIYLRYVKTEYDDKGKEKNKEQKLEKINDASALWKQPKSKLSDEDYRNFYKTISHENEDPLFWLHTRAEGTMEYTTLFYVPKSAPFDMYHVDYRPGVKLYVQRVFITDDEKELMPTYLRFLRGVIDSEDLPLNVSREILQQNRVMSSIRSASVKKFLGELQRIALENKDLYTTFIEQYNRPLKEGLYQDFANRDTLLELVRFKSSREEGWTSLEEYTRRMLADQKAIYYITGGDERTLRNSPLLEAYRNKEIEVLIMDDDFDEIVIPSIGKYKDHELKAVNRADAGEDLNDSADKTKEKELEPVIDRIRKALGDRVKDVRFSVRLADSPSCIVIDDTDPSMQMQQILKAMGQKEIPDVKPILEVNPNHPIIARLGTLGADDGAIVDDVAFLLLDQALLVEGAEVKEPAEFVKRLNRVLGRAL
jgi:molecular chaperone HtpG